MAEAAYKVGVHADEIVYINSLPLTSPQLRNLGMHLLPLSSTSKMLRNLALSLLLIKSFLLR